MANHTNWLNISTMSGSSGQTILKITAATNPEEVEKKAIIKAYNPLYGVSAATYVTLTQYEPYIYVTPSIVGIPASGGTYQFSINANCSYTIQYPEMVTDFSASAGTGNANITFSVASTTLASTIVENIIVRDGSGQYSTLVRLEQYGEGYQINYSPSAITIPFSAGSGTFVVTANCVYNVNKGSGTWYSVSPQSGYTGQTTFTVSSKTVNTGDTDWTSNIDIVGPEGSVGTVAVTQQKQGSRRISYTADTSNIPASGDVRTVTIDATDFINSSITASLIDAPEGVTATYNQQSTTRGIITLTVPENVDFERDITLVVTGRVALSSNIASAVIVWHQEEYEVVPIHYTADTSTVNASGDTRTITIDTDGLVASSITIGVEGATGVTTTYENGVITVTFPENEQDPRDITVSVRAKRTNGNDAAADITYRQGAGGIWGQPLTFNIISSGTIYWRCWDGSAQRTIQYKKNDGNWTTITSNNYELAPSIPVSAGDIVQFKGDNAAYANEDFNYTRFVGSDGAKYEVEGNIMSLIDSQGFSAAYALTARNTFYRLFYNSTGLTSIDNLLIPATTLASNCYDEMFSNCTGLTSTPELPATALTSACYYGMFQGCTSLTTAPELPATTMASSCYNRMFSGCTSLTTAPELPATTLANGCYYGMFYECTGLTTAPELPATTLASFCYDHMFNGCTSLATAPALPATTLADTCYHSMFSYCTSLTTAPELPASTLASFCYQNMFGGCTSLATAPALPATTLANGCYYGMFQGCTSLTTAPVLPATTLVEHCYQYMFADCTSLNYIICLATDISASYCTSGWVSNVASAGTFVKDSSMEDWTVGENGIPVNWLVYGDLRLSQSSITFSENVSVKTITVVSFKNNWTATTNDNWYGLSQYTGGTGETTITITANTQSTNRTGTVTFTDGNSVVELSVIEKVLRQEYLTFNITSGGTIKWDAHSPSYTKTIQYKKNEGNWTSITSTSSGTSISVSAGDVVQFRGNNATYATGQNYSNYFYGTTAKFEVEGNIMSLIDSTNFATATTLASSYTFYYLFNQCTGLTSAENLVLPATALTEYCYSYMFFGCTGLTTAPSILPATTLARYCYNSMFNGCTSLTTAPVLPATTLGTDLLAGGCYSYMFKGCTSLTTAPELPATTLISECYSNMFVGCTSLNYIKCLATNISAINCTSNWVSNVSSTGTFVTPSSTNWSTGASGIPEGWTRVNA